MPPTTFHKANIPNMYIFVLYKQTDLPKKRRCCHIDVARQSCPTTNACPRDRAHNQVPQQREISVSHRKRGQRDASQTPPEGNLWRRGSRAVPQQLVPFALTWLRDQIHSCHWPLRWLGGVSRAHSDLLLSCMSYSERQSQTNQHKSNDSEQTGQLDPILE